jgi:hypothetical protein
MSEHQPFKTEAEHLNVGAIVSVGVVAIVVFVLASLWSTRILKSGTEENWPKGPPSYPTGRRAEVGIVNQQLFELDDRAVLTREVQLKQLDSYGWVDRDAGVVHIPIEQAMEAMTQGGAR